MRSNTFIKSINQILMKNIFFTSRLLVTVLLIALISSCNGQTKTDSLSKKENQSTPTSKKELQLDFVNQFAKNADQISNQPDFENQVGQISSLYQDSRGLIWIGTHGKGLGLLISEKLNYFTLRDHLGSNRINDITEDINGDMWFATTNGVARYPGGEFTNYTTKDGLLDNKVNAVLADSKGNVWIGTEKGVNKFDGKTFSTIKLPNPNIEDPTYIISLANVWQIMEDSKGNIWFARDGYGATKYDGETFTHLTKKDGLRGNDIASITEDTHGNIWFGTIATRVPSKENKFHYIDSDDGGLSMYNGKEIIQFPLIKGLTKNDIYTLYSDSNGNVWVGSQQVGLYKYSNKKFKLYTEKSGFTYNSPQSVLEDSEGKIWIGYSKGLYSIKNEEITNITQSDLGFKGNPYSVKLNVNKMASDTSFELKVKVELDPGAYFVSPKSKDSYLGFFNIDIENNEHITIDPLITENPASVETLDEYKHEPVNFVTENTTYTVQFTTNSHKDFEVTGVVRFVIEPRCTMEEIPFLIMYRSGKFKIKKIGTDGC